MKQIEVNNLVDYWRITAEHDYKTMLGLFKIKRYSDSLFFGHIILEKILKAHAVRQLRKEAPKIHDLIRLVELAKIDLPDEELEYLKMVNRFNIRTRYPDVRFNFYKSCDLEYTKENLAEIKRLYKKLCQKLK